jgi:hypothetical protein
VSDDPPTRDWFIGAKLGGQISFVIGAAMAGIVDGRFPAGSAETMEDSILARNQIVPLDDAYPNWDTVIPWLRLYGAIGVTLARSLPL